MTKTFKNSFDALSWCIENPMKLLSTSTEETDFSKDISKEI